MDTKSKKKIDTENYFVKIAKNSTDEWVTEFYKNDKLIKKSEPTLYNGAVALASQYLLRAPYDES